MTTAVRERPILFSAPMVRALLDGRKTQTRRIITATGAFMGLDLELEADRDSLVQSCRFGVPGDRLWVRESARIVAKGPNCEHHYIDYRAGGLKDCADIDTVAACAGGFYAPGEAEDPEAPDEKGRWVWPWKTRSSIPRWASRITLEITDVRVQRVQEMSFYDWVADFAPSAMEQERALESGRGSRNQAEMASRLWDSINGPGSWAANPWVWALTFTRAHASPSAIVAPNPCPA